MDAGIKTSNLKRLRRIEGQIRGLQRMVEGAVYCPDKRSSEKAQEVYDELLELIYRHLR